LESATEESNCQHTVAELSAWLRNEGYDVDLIAQFFLENPCSATPWIHPDILVSIYTMAVKSESDVFTFVDQLDQHSPGFTQAAFAVIDGLLGTSQDLMATAGGLSGKPATFLKQHPLATTVLAAGGLTVTVGVVQSIRRRMAERAVDALEMQTHQLGVMAEHAAVNVATEELRSPAVMRNVERAELDPVGEAENIARFYDNVVIDPDMNYVKPLVLVEERASFLAREHINRHIHSITEELRAANKAEPIADDDWTFRDWALTPANLPSDLRPRAGLNEVLTIQKSRYRESDQFEELFNERLEGQLEVYKVNLSHAYQASLRQLDEEAIKAADTAEKRLKLAAKHSITELEAAVENDVLKTVSRAAVDFEKQLTKDIESATEKADNIIDNLEEL
jgi:hypothetical protein